MIELIPGTYIRLAGWPSSVAAKVNTARSYNRSHDRAVRLGHPTAWTVYVGSAIVDDGGAYYRRQEEIARAATVVEHGDIVKFMDGPEIYTVIVMGGNLHRPINSDPIHFHKEA